MPCQNLQSPPFYFSERAAKLSGPARSYRAGGSHSPHVEQHGRRRRSVFILPVGFLHSIICCITGYTLCYLCKVLDGIGRRVRYAWAVVSIKARYHTLYSMMQTVTRKEYMECITMPILHPRPRLHRSALPPSPSDAHALLKLPSAASHRGNLPLM
jgi:hypothetical protein